MPLVADMPIVAGHRLVGITTVAVNSVASIKDNPLGSPSISIALGDSKQYIKTGDTLLTASSVGLLGDVMNKLGPVGDQIKTTVHSLDSVLKNINTIFDPATKNNLQQVIANMNRTTASLVVSSASIQAMLNEQSGAITRSMNNVTSFTKNLGIGLKNALRFTIFKKQLSPLNVFDQLTHRTTEYLQ